MNTVLFGGSTSRAVRFTPPADTTNQAVGAAYSMSAFHALCQIACTGTFSSQFYDKSGGVAQLQQIKELSTKVTPKQLAQVALLSRERGYMKDMPAALNVALFGIDRAIAARILPRIVSGGDKVLKAMFQMARSGEFGPKGMTYSFRRAVERLLHSWTPEQLVTLSIGNKPSMKDIFKLVHPRPHGLSERALWGYLLGMDEKRWGQGASMSDLPDVIKHLRSYDQATDPRVQLQLLPFLQKVRWERLGGNAKGPDVWKALALSMKPQALRMNLNTMVRHNVFDDETVKSLIIAKLTDAEAIRKSRQFPYGYLSAYNATEGNVPYDVRAALHKAADIACGNVPDFGAPVAICVDVSGSMSMNHVTGPRAGNQTTAKTIDVAALMAVAIWRKNPNSVLIPFDTQVHRHSLDPSDSLLSLSSRLAQYGGGGTSCSLPIMYLSQQLAHKPFAGVVMLSDNESWADPVTRGTATMQAFNQFVDKQRRLGKYPQPKMVNIDLCPNQATQVPTGVPNILNIGGFSDAVFELTDMFLKGDINRFVNYAASIEV